MLSYACYRVEGSDDLLGDPRTLAFTEMLEARFGWTGPKGKARSAFDYLPLIFQADPTTAPELFELPPTCAPPVHIHHPEYPFLTELNIQWYPIPAVCALDLTVRYTVISSTLWPVIECFVSHLIVCDLRQCGGLLYTAIPFNGWYADVEVIRDLCDHDRYDMLRPLADAMGLDTSRRSSLWKDKAQLVLTEAVLYSFEKGNVAMVDHHTLIEGFYEWYQTELKDRGFCPGNWKWVVPPQVKEDGYIAGGGLVGV